MEMARRCSEDSSVDDAVQEVILCILLRVDWISTQIFQVCHGCGGIQHPLLKNIDRTSLKVMKWADDRKPEGDLQDWDSLPRLRFI